MNLSLNKKHCKMSINKNVITFSVFCAIAVTIITKQLLLREAIGASIKMCLSTIMPSVFPFMILSDYLMCNFTFNVNPESKIKTAVSLLIALIVPFCEDSL